MAGAICVLAGRLGSGAPGTPGPAASEHPSVRQELLTVDAVVTHFQGPFANDVRSKANPVAPPRSVPLEWSQWALVAAAFATLIAITWQAAETRRAVRQAQRSVEIVQAENRPWLLVRFAELGDDIDGPILADPYPPSCAFHITNYGKTPARLLRMKADLALGVSPSEPPTDGISESGTDFSPRLIPQGEALSQTAKAAGWSPTFYQASVYCPGKTQTKYLWLRGAFEYTRTTPQRDLGGSVYRTEFCYVWVPLTRCWRLVHSTAD